MGKCYEFSYIEWWMENYMLEWLDYLIDSSCSVQIYNDSYVLGLVTYISELNV